MLIAVSHLSFCPDFMKGTLVTWTRTWESSVYTPQPPPPSLPISQEFIALEFWILNSFFSFPLLPSDHSLVCATLFFFWTFLIFSLAFHLPCLYFIHFCRYKNDPCSFLTVFRGYFLPMGWATGLGSEVEEEKSLKAVLLERKCACASPGGLLKCRFCFRSAGSGSQESECQPWSVEVSKDHLLGK